MRASAERVAQRCMTIVARKWEDEPAEAAALWTENIEPMDDKPRRDVEIHLPSIRDD